jgi:tetratricopeptide (TPR) repeat protein
VGALARWVVASVTAAASFAGCALGLVTAAHMDIAQALGWAALPLGVALGILGPWAERARDKNREQPDGLASAAGDKMIMKVHAWLRGSITNVFINRPVGHVPPATRDRSGWSLGQPRVSVVGDVPRPPVEFQARTRLEAELAQGCARVKVLIGPTGTGKTHLAAAYARKRIKDQWRLVAWVDARNTELMVTHLAAVAEAMGLSCPGEDARQAARRLRNELEGSGRDCLVVFDSASGDCASDLDDLRLFLPATGESQVLITTTRRGAADLGDVEVIHVDAFTMGEALTFLHARTGRADQAGAMELADALDRLPLGLAQAAALIAREGLPYEIYLQRLRTVPVSRYLEPVRGDRYSDGIAEAILLSLGGIERDEAGACGTVLDVLSVLSAGGVSRQMLYRAIQAGAIPSLGDGMAAAIGWDAAVGKVADASLLAFSRSDSLIMHPLVMRVVRERQVAARAVNGVAAVAVAILISVATAVERPWEEPTAIQELADHVAALDEHVSPRHDQLETQTAAQLLRLRSAVTRLLNQAGNNPGQVIGLCPQLITDCSRIMGPDHPDTLTACDHLAVAYRVASQMTQAIPLFEDILSRRVCVLGEHHPDTLTSRDRLAVAYYLGHDLRQAIPLLQSTLAERERVLGRDHRDTLTSRDHLAIAYRADKQLDKAIPLLQNTLAERERVLGRDHPETLTSYDNLALAYRSSRQLDLAIGMHKLALGQRERVLGQDHIDTLASRSNLARAYHAAKRFQDAMPLYKAVLADCERVLGSHHSATETVRRRAAEASKEASKHDGRSHERGARWGYGVIADVLQRARSVI